MVPLVLTHSHMLTAHICAISGPLCVSEEQMLTADSKRNSGFVSQLGSATPYLLAAAIPASEVQPKKDKGPHETKMKP